LNATREEGNVQTNCSQPSSGQEDREEGDVQANCSRACSCQEDGEEGFGEAFGAARDERCA
jgi:hypothetical protein